MSGTLCVVLLPCSGKPAWSGGIPQRTPLYERDAEVLGETPSGTGIRMIGENEDNRPGLTGVRKLRENERDTNSNNR